MNAFQGGPCQERGKSAYMEDGVGHLPIGNDGGAPLLCRAPRRVHLGHHATSPSHALVPELDLAVQFRAVCVDDPAQARQSVFAASAPPDSNPLGAIQLQG